MFKKRFLSFYIFFLVSFMKKNFLPLLSTGLDEPGGPPIFIIFTSDPDLCEIRKPRLGHEVPRVGVWEHRGKADFLDLWVRREDSETKIGISHRCQGERESAEAPEGA